MSRAVPPASPTSECTSSRDEIETPKPESRCDGKVVAERYELLRNRTLEGFLRREIEERVWGSKGEFRSKSIARRTPTFYAGVERTTVRSGG